MGTPDNSNHRIRRVAVLGAGTMGAQIAALIAERGVQCDLLDMSAELVEESKSRLLTMRPRVVSDHSLLEKIRPGSFRDDISRLREADWVIEAIVEREQPKLELLRGVAPHLRAEAVLSTNTSGIPITQLGRALTPRLRKRFLGTHFFNPPRYLHLLEVIPTEETEAQAIDTVRAFAGGVLGKGVVVARDVPGFITNRIGCFYFLAAMRAADEYGLTPDEVDAISGPLMGRSSSATYRTIDLVGVDILLDICDNTRVAVESEEEQRAFTPPEVLRDMKRKGWLGNKAGQGFYQRARRQGKSHVLTLNASEMRYVERSGRFAAFAVEMGRTSDSGDRLRKLVSSDSVAGRFAWRTLSELIAFAAMKVGEVADDIASIDRAMRWGFNWELGPFETCDALGVAECVRRMRVDGLHVPGWVSEIADRGGGFYRREGCALMQASESGGYTRVTE